MAHGRGRPVRLDLVGAPAPALASLTWSTWYPDDDVAALQAVAGRAALEVERVPWSKRASESWPPADASASYGSAAASLGALPVLAHAFVVSVVAGMCFSDAQPTSAAGVAGKVAGGAGLAAGLLLVLLAVMAGWVDQRPSGARRERRERSSPDRRRPAPSRHTEGHAP